MSSSEEGPSHFCSLVVFNYKTFVEMRQKSDESILTFFRGLQHFHRRSGKCIIPWKLNLEHLFKVLFVKVL